MIFLQVGYVVFFLEGMNMVNFFFSFLEVHFACGIHRCNHWQATWKFWFRVKNLSQFPTSRILKKSNYNKQIKLCFSKNIQLFVPVFFHDLPRWNGPPGVVLTSMHSVARILLSVWHRIAYQKISSQTNWEETLAKRQWLGGGNSNIFYFHPENWGR